MLSNGHVERNLGSGIVIDNTISGGPTATVVENTWLEGNGGDGIQVNGILVRILNCNILGPCIAQGGDVNDRAIRLAGDSIVVMGNAIASCGFPSTYAKIELDDNTTNCFIAGNHSAGGNRGIIEVSDRLGGGDWPAQNTVFERALAFRHTFPTDPALPAASKAGDVIMNAFPFTGSASEPLGWVCIEGGTPGRWEPLQLVP